MSNVKCVFERKFLSPVENGHQNGGFWGKKGVKLNFWFCVFWRILRQNPYGRLGCRWFEEPTKNSRVNNLMREIAHAQKRNPLSDLDGILQDGRYPGHNHVRKFWRRSLKGFRGGGWSNFGLSHWIRKSSLQTLSHYRASVWSWSQMDRQTDTQTNAGKNVSYPIAFAGITTAVPTNVTNAFAGLR